MGYVVAVVSGKGGVGKTALSLALAQLSAASGARTVLIDVDEATRGLTHYLSSFMDAHAPGLLEANHVLDAQVVSIAKDEVEFSFVPVVSDPDADGFDTLSRTDRSVATDVVARLTMRSDVLILDFQAGVSPLLDEILPIVDSVLVVTEADPVSVSAVQGLRRHIERTRGALPIFALVNRAMPEEGHYFESLTDYIPVLRWLGVLPLDVTVRKAFFRRSLPLEKGRADPFTIALLEALSRADGALKVIAQRAKSWALGERAAPVADHEQLIGLRDELEWHIARYAYRSERRRLVSFGGATMFSIVATLGGLFGALERIDAFLAIGLALSGAIGTIGALVWPSGRVARDEVYVNRLRRDLARVERELGAYSIALFHRDRDRRG